MKKFSFFILLVFGCTALSFVASAKDQPWAGKMQSLSAIIKDLVPILASDKKFNDPQNDKALLDGATKLSEMSHGIKSLPQKDMASMLPDQDPSIQLIAELFESEALQSVAALKQGHKDYARSRLRSLTTYCVACHTRGETGPKFKGMTPKSLAQGLEPIEKAELYIALREFDMAQDVLNSLTQSESLAKKDPVSWERSVRMLLSVLIRVKNNPDTALAALDNAAGNTHASKEIQSAIPIWKKSLLEWKNDDLNSSNHLQEAQKLIAQALRERKLQGAKAADVSFLRASTLLHEALKQNPKGPLASRALYLTGITYQALDDFGLWSLHELYFEACIKNAPHTASSQMCYQQLDRSVTFSYSGSEGTSIPDDLQARLGELKKLAY